MCHEGYCLFSRTVCCAQLFLGLPKPPSSVFPDTQYHALSMSQHWFHLYSWYVWAYAKYACMHASAWRLPCTPKCCSRACRGRRLLPLYFMKSMAHISQNPATAAVHGLPASACSPACSITVCPTIAQVGMPHKLLPYITCSFHSAQRAIVIAMPRAAVRATPLQQLSCPVNPVCR